MPVRFITRHVHAHTQTLSGATVAGSRDTGSDGTTQRETEAMSKALPLSSHRTLRGARRRDTIITPLTCMVW
eukprot:5348913-Pyramimonas_sp.AAC.1